MPIPRLLRIAAGFLLANTLAVAAPAATPDRDALLDRVVEVEIQAQPLTDALFALSKQAGVQIVTSPDVIAGNRSAGVHGRMRFGEALAQLLRGTRLGFHAAGANTVGIDAAAPAAAAPSREEPAATRPTSTTQAAGNPSAASLEPKTQNLAAVEVTGSHIIGAPPASPVIAISREQALEAGQTNLGEVIRSLPQNFSGGQNPGVGIGGGDIGNQNLTGGSTLNLRGLGQDATLTLLNGRRLAYDGFSQGVDISQIPLAALDRIEIVADGASAIYGSDAVGGVANVILKPDYDGVATSVRFGKATSGGDFQQQYGIVGGHAWAGGGFITALDFENDTSIDGSQRSYTDYLPAPNTLLPTNKAKTALVSAHQDLGDAASLKLDALYTHRKGSGSNNEDTGIYGSNTDTANYTFSPTLTLHLPARWTLSVNGTYGGDRSTSEQIVRSTDDGSVTDRKVCYCNRIAAWEVDSEGPLFRLPGGDARAALGGGYRRISLERSNETSARTHSYYAFAEMYAPLAEPDSNIPLIQRLSLSAAVRHERYSEFGSVTTPKLGVIYAPSADFDLSASWGKSFKIPTLLQEYQGFVGYLWTADFLGGTGYPDTATGLMAYGGNRNLRPERATSWTATLNLHPAALPALQSSLSYFHIDYRDRIAQGVTNLNAALSDPAYRQFVNLDPTEAQKQALIDQSGSTFYNFSGLTYDPSQVIAIVDDRYFNIAAQRIHGVDFSASYRFDLGTGSLTLSEDASWLASRQRNGPLAPEFDLAGTIYNPPHWRSRSGLRWERGELTLSAFYNYIGGVTNTQLEPTVEGKPMHTLDVTAIWHPRNAAGALRDVDLSISIQNVGNSRPPFVQNAYSFAINYDPTNYSAIGRFVSVSLSKQWH